MSEDVKKGKCPCCPKHCDLSRPQCHKGVKYAKTGEMPKQSKVTGYETAQETKPTAQDKLFHSLRAVGRALKHGVDRDNVPDDLFSALTSDEQEILASLMDKLNLDFESRFAPQKGSKHEHKAHTYNAHSLRD